eukprot:3941370-Rhodomonas_salina.2
MKYKGPHSCCPAFAPLVAPYTRSVPDIAYRTRRRIAAYARSVPDIAYRARRRIADFTRGPPACDPHVAVLVAAYAMSVPGMA